MTEASQKIIEGLKEALAVARGEAEPYRVHRIARPTWKGHGDDGSGDNWWSDLNEPNPPYKPSQE